MENQTIVKNKTEVISKNKFITFNISGLDCAHCATLIEEKLSTLPYIQDVSLNFINKELKLSFVSGTNIKSEIKNISILIDSIESGVTITELSKNKYITFNINGLDCAHCAGLIEEKLSTLPYIQDVSLNFINKELKLSFITGTNIKSEIRNISMLIDSIESGVTISETSKTPQTDDENELDQNQIKLIRIVTGGVLLLSGNFLNLDILLVGAYIVLGYDIVFKALKNITKGKLFDENFLMSIATLAAFYIGEYPEAVAVMLFYQIGEYFQEKAVGKSRKAIKSLIGIRAEYATRENGDIVAPEDIQIGDIIIVKAGEKLPLDGVVIEGSSFLDMSALIGEAVPRKASVGDEVLSGSINNNSILKIKVTKAYEDSTVAKILELVENSALKKSKAENFISKFAKIYTPIVVVSAFLIATLPPLLGFGDFKNWLEVSIIFLVSSCPCALVVSVPLSFFSGIGTASKRGILIKGSMYMQNLSEIDTIVFDKTGTITKGVFEIIQIKPNNIEQNELLKNAYLLEKYSNHPVAKSIIDYYETNIAKIDDFKIDNFEEISGCGLSGEINGDIILVGNGKLLDKYNISYEEIKENGSIVYVAKNTEYIGYILVSDVIKDNALDTIKKLKQIGIKNTIMLSGDRTEMAQFVANKVGINKVYAELLPQDKVSNFEKIKAENNTGKIAFVGDGINDAPVLAISDVGLAMGGVGSDAAIEAADAIIMNDDLEKIYDSIVISKNTLKIVKMNVIFSLAIKFLVLGLAPFGITTIWMAVFADVGVTFIAILNSMRKKI